MTQVPGEAREEGVEWRLSGLGGRVIAIFSIAGRGRRGLTDWPPLLLDSWAAPSVPGPPVSVSERVGPLVRQTPLPLQSPQWAQACVSPSPTAPICPELLRMA